MKVTRKIFGELAEAILEGGAKRATKILSERLTIKATFQGKRASRDRTQTIVFTLGAPNYAERQFIKAAKANGKKFNVLRLQVGQ